MAVIRDDTYFPSLKNNAKVRFDGVSGTWLLTQIIQGLDEIGLARIGPATSIGFASLASVATTLMVAAMADMAGGSPASGSISRAEEQPARPIQNTYANRRTRFSPTNQALT